MRATGTQGLSTTAAQNAIGPLKIIDKTYLGNVVEYHFEAQSRPMIVRMPRGGLRGQQDFAQGQSVFVTLEPDAIRVLVA